MTKQRAKPIDIRGLCRWATADTAATLKRLGISKLFAKLGIGATAEGLFGSVPATQVHKGDVTVAKGTLIDADGNGIFIIEGSLTVKGPLTFTASDAYTVLVVTGDLMAEHVLQAMDTQLVVLGTTTIAGLLYIDVSDAGFTMFRGPVTSLDRIVVDNNVDYAVPRFAKKPVGRTHEHPGEFWSATFAKIVGDEIVEAQDIHDALVAGVPILGPDPVKSKPAKGAAKQVTAAELKAMSIEEVLSLTGFVKAMFEGPAVNPNWLTKGRAGQPLEELHLNSDTVVEKFPAALAALKTLKLLMFRDADNTTKVLSSLGTLTGLETLRIVSTQMTSLPAGLGALSRLRHLELRDNRKLRNLSPLIGKLTALETLELDGNGLAELPTVLAKLPALQRLVVKEPKVTAWPPALERFRT